MAKELVVKEVHSIQEEEQLQIKKSDLSLVSEEHSVSSENITTPNDQLNRP